MSVSVTMPRLGESVSEGTVTRWLKQQGEQVAADEPLLEVSTDKVDTEIPSPAAGVLAEIKVGEDETVEVGAELATIDDGGSGGGTDSGGASGESGGSDEQSEPAAEKAQPDREAQQASAPATERAAPEPPTQPEQPPASQAPPTAEKAEPARASQHAAGGDSTGGPADQAAYVTPLVRKLAAEQQVDLSALRGTGVGGRIRKQDVLDAAQAAQQAAAPASGGGTSAGSAQELRGRTEKMSRFRGVIASRMIESLQTSAQLTSVVEVDVTRIARLRARAKDEFARREGVKLTFLPFFSLAAVEALKAHPKVNASVDTDAGTITYHDAEHLGIAVDTERGLLVPVIHHAGDLNIGGLARKIADLAERTRTNKVGPDELGGGTFTVTNTGSRGALFDTPIINQPQVAILGTGTVVKRPIVVDDPDLGEIVTVRSMVYLALTYDHRLVDGADAARFLSTVKERLEGGDFEASVGL